MKLIIFLFLSLCYYNFGVASPVFRASSIKTRAFDAHRLLDDNLINKLPLVQREILFSLLRERTIILGSSESERWAAAARGSGALLPEQSESQLMAAVATRAGYEQLLAERRFSSGFAYEEAVFGLMNYWKVNLHEVMPHTAALTDEDFKVSSLLRDMMEISTMAVLNIVVMGHANIVKIFRSSNHSRIREILFAAHKRWQLKDGEAVLVQKFSEDQLFYTNYLRGRRVDHSRYARQSNVNELAGHVEQMEKIATIEVERDKANAIATFYAEQALADYDAYLVRVMYSAKHELAEQYSLYGADRVAAAVIADLGIDGYVAMREMSIFGIKYEKFYDFLAEELDSQRGSWLRIFSWYKR